MRASSAAARRLRTFLDTHGIRYYTEHLSYTGDDGHLYDLVPIPFTAEAVHHVAGRIRRAMEVLERPIAVENVSYYAAPGRECLRDIATELAHPKPEVVVAGGATVLAELRACDVLLGVAAGPD